MEKITNIGQIWASKIFFVGLPLLGLDFVASYHSMQFQEKRTIKTQENGKKPHFGPKFGSSNFFLNLASSVTRYYGQLSSCTISEMYGQTNERTDRQPRVIS